MVRATRLILFIVILCFFISGTASLIYEVVWARYLGLFLGHTSYAVVSVLVAFMGGLALGNAWLGTRADRVRKPLAVYGWLEVGIGCYALLYPFYDSLCHRAFVRVAGYGQPGSPGVLALKFGFSLVLMMLPTILMGATLPMLAKFVTGTMAELRRCVAVLYFINSAGAVAGCWLADFWWIPTFGLKASVYGGALLNLAVGGLVLLLSRRAGEGNVSSAAAWSPSTSTAPPGRSQRGGKSEAGGARTRRLGDPEKPPPAISLEESSAEKFTAVELKMVIIGIGLSGFAAMLYEVVWTRLLALVLGASTHAFALMLMTFIAGIASGAWLIYRWQGLRQTLKLLAWAELGLAASVALAMWCYDFLPYWFIKVSSLLARRNEAYPLYVTIQALICFAVMFVPAVCLGATLPLACRIATANLAQAGRSVGRVFAWNTAGNMIGAALTGLWLMPILGLARTLAVGIALNALIGWALLRREKFIRQPALAGLAVLCGAAIVCGAGWHFDQDWQRVLSLGVWRRALIPASLTEFRKLAQANHLRFYRDGAGATVSVNSWVEEGAEYLNLKINGKPDAGTAEDVSTQLLLGHVPMLLKPDARKALVIGLGSGMTCGAVACHPSIERLDAVEIQPEVVRAARLFAAHNGGVLDDPRLRLVVEDAKSFLQMTKVTYDVIISEPSNPWMAGVAGVFSREFYENCRERLQTNGLMVQWVHLYESNDRALNVVLATFGSVFPYFSIWQSREYDVLLVGSPRPISVEFSALEARFRDPRVHTDLGRINLLAVPVFLSCEIISQQNAPFIAPLETPVHSDLHPVLEFLAQRAFFAHSSAEQWRLFEENYSPRSTTFLAQYLQLHPLTLADLRAFSSFYFSQELPHADLFRSLLNRWQRELPASGEPFELSARLSNRGSTDELELRRLAPVQELFFKHAQESPEFLRRYSQFWMNAYRDYRSIFYTSPSKELEATLERLLQTDRSNWRVYKLQLAELAWDRGDDEACLRLGQSAFEPDPAAPGAIAFPLDPSAPRRVIADMIEAHWRAGRIAAAWEVCQTAKEAGYVNQGPDSGDPVLEMVYRKVKHEAGRAR
jgi:spermidine synthase